MAVRLRTFKRLWRRFLSSRRSIGQKIIKSEQISNVFAHTRNNKVLISTNGCFDILHPGHIKFLETAKELGDILVVAVNSDSSVRSIKGDNRPLISEVYRTYALASLEFTDYVVVFDDKTPEKVLGVIKPDIHVKGEEYKKTGIPEQKTIESNGGKVLYLPHLDGFSTTSLIEKIKNSS